MAAFGNWRSSARTLCWIAVAVSTALSLDSSAANSSEQYRLARTQTDVTIALPRRSALSSTSARFFTINRVLEMHDHGIKPGRLPRLASVNSRQTLTDVENGLLPSAVERSDEPFGMLTFRAPQGVLWTKWKKLEADLRQEARILSECRANIDQCSSPAALHFLNVISRARQLPMRARIATVNRSINLAVRYMSDFMQHGVPDMWSGPLATFASGRGDCEDYAIAKYMAFRELGIASADMRLILARDRRVGMDHAVLAVRNEGKWLLLDNRFTRLVDAGESSQLTPLFSLGNDGVKLFAVPYANLRNRENVEVAADVLSPVRLNEGTNTGGSWGPFNVELVL
jgi:predicted transglutaminase-like cysteine proteinase